MFRSQLRRRRLFFWPLLVLMVLGTFVGGAAAKDAPPTSGEQPIIWYFWGEGCPYCAKEHEFLTELKERYPEVTIRSFEVFGNRANLLLMQRMALERGEVVQAVPVTIIGDEVFVGFNQAIARAIEEAILLNGREGEQSEAGPTDGADPSVDPQPPSATVPGETVSAEGEFVLELPLFGAVDLSGHGLLLSTFLISFVDGLNPCSLWVLSVLLALVIRSRSRRKTLWVGVTFLGVTALIYGAFIAGLFSIFSFVEMTLWIRIVVAAVALIAAVIHIKDYFAFGKGISLSIPDRYKPGLYDRMRSILHAESLWRSILLTIVLAIGVSFIELPCTAGLPILWTNLVAAENIGTTGFLALLALYLLVYVIDELILFIAALVTLRVTKVEERHGRALKLAGGVLMLFLGLTLLLKPDLMNSVLGTTLVFAAAAGTVLVILAAGRIRKGLRSR